MSELRVSMTDADVSQVVLYCFDELFLLTFDRGCDFANLAPNSNQLT